jgi:hypothetical protein
LDAAAVPSRCEGQHVMQPTCVHICSRYKCMHYNGCRLLLHKPRSYHYCQHQHNKREVCSHSTWPRILALLVSAGPPSPCDKQKHPLQQGWQRHEPARSCVVSA